MPKTFVCPICDLEFSTSKKIRSKKPPTCSPACRHKQAKKPREERTCICGCGKRFTCLTNSNQKYFEKECYRAERGRPDRSWATAVDRRFPWEKTHCYPGGFFCARYSVEDCLGDPKIHQADGSCRVEPERAVGRQNSSLAGQCTIQFGHGYAFR